MSAGGPGQVGAWRGVQLVMRRELMGRLRSKSFLISTAVTIVAIVALIVVRSIEDGGTDSRTVGVVGDPAPVEARLEAAAISVGERFRVKGVEDRAAAERGLRDDEYEVVLLEPGDATDARDLRVLVQQELPSGVEQALLVFAQQGATGELLSSRGVSLEALQERLGEVELDVDRLEAATENAEERYAIGFIAVLLIYGSILMYGAMVAQGVVEEKANRIVELLLTAIRPWQLILGKVLGIGVVGVLQLGVVAACGVAAAIVTDVLDLPSGTLIGMVAWSIVWFLVGYLTYALLFGALGALVSRQEEVGSVTTPVYLLAVVPYLVAVSMVEPGERVSGTAETLSFVPLLSPMVMPMRIAVGVPAWQPWAALGLSVVALLALTWLAGRIYTNSVLRTGARVRLRDALSRQHG